MSSTLKQPTREAVEDVTAANYGVADIPANRIVLLDTSNQLSTTAARGVKLPVASGGVAGTYGVTVETLYAPASGYSPKPGRVAVSGAIQVLADGSVTVGAYIQASDTSGKEGYGKTCGAGIQEIGQAETSAGDGEPFILRICKARNA